MRQDKDERRKCLEVLDKIFQEWPARVMHERHEEMRYFKEIYEKTISEIPEESTDLIKTLASE